MIALADQAVSLRADMERITLPWGYTCGPTPDVVNARYALLNQRETAAWERLLEMEPGERLPPQMRT